jgi:hypothetical protein
MRGKVAKRLRRMAGYTSGTTVKYGAQEAILTRKVIKKGVVKTVTDKFKTGALVCLRPRRTYLNLKAEYIKG